MVTAIGYVMEIAIETVIEAIIEVSMELSLKLPWRTSLRLSWELLFSLKSVVEIVVEVAMETDLIAICPVDEGILHRRARILRFACSFLPTGSRTGGDLWEHG